MNPFSAWLRDARRQPDTRYVDTCDGVRAAAIMIVAWFHIWQQSWLYPGLELFGRHISFDPLVRSGYIWVDVMILVSGFCMYLSFDRQLGERGRLMPTADFYARRLIRIHPSYMLTIIIMLIVALATDAYHSQAHFRRDLLSHLTYTHMIFYDAYYATNLGSSLWTLAVELQFYLIFPLIFRAFRKLPATTFAVMTAAALAFRGYVGQTFEDVSIYFNQLPAYLDTFAFGMAAAAVHVRWSHRRHGALTRIVCSAVCVLLCMALWQVVRAQSACSGTEAIRMGQMNNRLAMGLLGSALLLCSAHAGWVVRHILANPVTKFLSAVSLQFYIWHQTLAVWIRQMRLIPSEAVNPNYEGDIVWQRWYTLACFGIALALAALLTYGFEKPAARWLQNKWDALRARRREKRTKTAEE